MTLLALHILYLEVLGDVHILTFTNNKTTMTLSIDLNKLNIIIEYKVSYIRTAELFPLMYKTVTVSKN